MSRRLTDVCREAGITYRQGDYWITQGWVGSVEPVGSGNARSIDDGTAARIIAMGRLTRAGIEVRAARRAAESMVERGVNTADLTGEVAVIILKRQEEK